MKEATEIVMVLDKSGSMMLLIADVVGGFNSFLKEQQQIVGEAFLTVVLFNTSYVVLHERVPIKEVEPLNEKNYKPMGNTALIDSFMQTILNEGNLLSALPEEERPNKVIVVVMTDGEENSSRKFTKEQIQQKVKHQEEVYNWKFLYFGANVDAFSEAKNIGISAQSAHSYASNYTGIRKAYSNISADIASFRNK